MSLVAIQKALDRFESAGNTVFRKNAGDSEAIQQFGASLGLELPADFAEFYATYHCISFGAVDLLSIDGMHSAYDFARARRLPRNYVPFISDNSDLYLVACRRKGKSKDSQFGCVFCLPGIRGAELEFRSPEFAGFIVKKIELESELD